MNPGQDKTTKAFFKDHWRQPLRRWGKIFIPIFLAALISVTGVFGIYYCGPLIVPQVMLFLFQPSLTDPVIILSHAFLAVGMAVIFVLGGGALNRHYQSQFRPVRLRILRRRKKN